jgi:hypothetical protein
MAPEYGATTGFFRSMNTHSTTCADRPHRGADSRVEAYCRRDRPVVRPRGRAALHAKHRDRSRRSACTSPARGGRRTCWIRRQRPRPSRALGFKPVAAVRACRATRSPSPPSPAAPTRPTPPADRRRPGRAQGPSVRVEGAGLGQDLARTRLAGRRGSYLQRAGLLEDLVGRGLRHRRLWLHHLHRQLRAADRDDPRRAGAAGARRWPFVGQPQLPRPRASRPGAELHHVAAAGGRLRPGRRRRAQPARGAGAGRRRRSARLPEGPVAIAEEIEAAGVNRDPPTTNATS